VAVSASSSAATSLVGEKIGRSAAARAKARGKQGSRAAVELLRATKRSVAKEDESEVHAFVVPGPNIFFFILHHPPLYHLQRRPHRHVGATPPWTRVPLTWIPSCRLLPCAVSKMAHKGGQWTAGSHRDRPSAVDFPFACVTGKCFGTVHIGLRISIRSINRWMNKA
jgi:hypothetical protein